MANNPAIGEDPALQLDYYPYHYRTALRQSDGRGGNGHVANGKIAMLGDDAREEVHTHIMGGPLSGPTIQLVETNFRFFRELTHPGLLTIGVGILAIGNSSIREVLGFFREDSCYVLSRIVTVKTAGGRSTPFTDAERARAARFLIAPAS